MQGPLILDGIITSYSQIRDKEKATIFATLCDGGAHTRKSLALEMKMRPATVSKVVGELIEQGLVLEDSRKANTGKGRPEFFLRINRNRFQAITVSMVSMKLCCANINLFGEVLQEFVIDLSPSTTTDELDEILSDIIFQTKKRIAKDSECVGIAFALPGLIDGRNGVWIKASRLPLIKNLPLASYSADIPSYYIKNIDAILKNEMIINSSLRSKSVLLFHWGYGIGLSFANNGALQHNQKSGYFGEIGQWETGDREDTTISLESELAIEAVLGKLERTYPSEIIPTDESLLFDMLEKTQIKLSDLEPIWTRILRLLNNIFLMFFPDEILIVSPFINQKNISELIKGLLTRNKDFHTEEPVIRSLRASNQSIYWGACHDFFTSSLYPLLRMKESL